MASIDIKDLEAKTVGRLELSDAVFAAPVNEELLWEAVRHYGAARRAGTHKTKGRAEVSGSGRKLWKQKGTGRARIGSIRSPLWRHGGTVHGPQPRDYSWTMPRKKLLGALRSALAAKYRDQELVVVEEFALEAVKTQRLRAALRGLLAKPAAEGRPPLSKTKAARFGSALLVAAKEGNRNLELSARNLPAVELLTAASVHPYHLLKYKNIVLSRAALEHLQAAAAPRGKRAAAAEAEAEARA